MATRRRNPGGPPLSLVSPATAPPEPPITLGEAGQKLWDATLRQFWPLNVLALEVLAEGCAARDRSTAISRQIAALGEAATPALIKLELEARAFTARTLAKLANAVPKRDIGRPPSAALGVTHEQMKQMKPWHV